MYTLSVSPIGDSLADLSNRRDSVIVRQMRAYVRNVLQPGTRTCVKSSLAKFSINQRRVVPGSVCGKNNVLMCCKRVVSTIRMFVKLCVSMAARAASPMPYSRVGGGAGGCISSGGREPVAAGVLT